MRTGTATRWWLGWHPLHTIGGGGLAGIVVGNVLVTWSVRAAMLHGGLSASLGAVLRPVVGDGTGYLLVLALVPVVGSAAVGALLGLGLWLAGVRTVNRRADRERERLLAEIDAGRDESTTYMLGQSHGGSPLVSPARAYDLARVRLTPTSLVVGTYRLRLDDRRIDPGDEVEVPYDAVQSIDAADGILVVDAGDRRVSIPATELPAELLDALYERAPPARRGNSATG